MALTPEEEARYQSLKKELGSEFPKGGLTPEEEARYQTLKKELTPVESKTWGQTAKDIASDVVVGLPRSHAKGVAQLADIVAWPARKGLETIMGREIPTLEEAIPQYTSKSIVGRIGGKAAEFAGSMVGGAGIGSIASKAATTATKPLLRESLSKIGNFLGNPKITKDVAQLGALGAATGTASGTLQEAGMHPLLADLSAAIGVPIATLYSSLRKVALKKPNISAAEENTLRILRDEIGEEGMDQILGKLRTYESPIKGYEPTTAEIAQHPVLSQFERSYEGEGNALKQAQLQGTKTLHESLEKLIPEKAEVGNVTTHFQNLKEKAATKATKAQEKAQKELGKYVEPYQGKETREYTGNRLREIVEDTLSTHKEARTAATEPLYNAVKNVEQGIETSAAKDFVKNLIKKEGIVGPQKRKMESLLGAMESNTATKETKDLYKQIQEEFSGVSPGAMEAILSQLGINAPLPKASQLDKTLSLIGEEISIAKRAGKHSTAHNLMGLKESLLKDIDLVAPEVSKARSVYAKKSIPISDITRGKGLSKVVEQDIYKTQHKVGAAELPKLFFRGEKSVENARNVMKLLKNDKEGKTLLKQHLYEDFTRHVTDSTGKVSPNKVKTYLKNNPGVDIIDPGFRNNIKKIETAQQRYNQTKKTLEHPSRYVDKDAFTSVLGPQYEGMDAHRVIENIFTGKNQVSRMSKVVDVAKTNKDAYQGLKRGVLEHTLAKVKTGDTAFLKDSKQTLSKVLSPDEMKIIKLIEDVTKMRNTNTKLAKTSNSATKSNISLEQKIIGQVGKKVFRKLIGHVPGLGWAGDIGGAIYDFAKASKNELAKEMNKKTFEDMLASPDIANTLLSKNESMKKYNTLKESIYKPIKNSATINALKYGVDTLHS